jgi:hypothetical protein
VELLSLKGNLLGLLRRYYVVMTLSSSSSAQESSGNRGRLQGKESSYYTLEGGKKGGVSMICEKSEGVTAP